MNIGNSILPSNNSTILIPIECEFGNLVVNASTMLDTHFLILIKSDNTVAILAEHPNGFSCHSLGQNILNGFLESAIEQANYIKRCGGKVDLEYIQKLLT